MSSAWRCSRCLPCLFSNACRSRARDMQAQMNRSRLCSCLVFPGRSRWSAGVSSMCDSRDPCWMMPDPWRPRETFNAMAGGARLSKTDCNASCAGPLDRTLVGGLVPVARTVVFSSPYFITLLCATVSVASQTFPTSTQVTSGNFFDASGTNMSDGRPRQVKVKLSPFLFLIEPLLRFVVLSLLGPSDLEMFLKRFAIASIKSLRGALQQAMSFSKLPLENSIPLESSLVREVLMA